MRTTYTILFMLIVFASCAKKESASVEDVVASNNLENIKAKKAELDGQQQALATQLELLNAKIAELDTTKKVPLITAFEVKQQMFKHYVELQGNVKTKQNVLIYPETAGLLKEVKVKEGQKVTKGQVLAKIDDGGVKQQLAQLEAAAALAKTTYERQKRLWEQKIGSEIQFLQTKTNYITQQNAVESLKKQLEKSEIKAPFDGEIDDVIKDEGVIVAPGPGSEVFRIVNLKKMYIETDVPESYLKTVKNGKKVIVELPVLGKTTESSIRQAGNFIDPANRTFKVEVPVENKNGDVKPNLTAKLMINDYTNESAILIPQSIISENANGDQYIYVVENIKNVNGNREGVAKRRVITTGKIQGSLIEVISGVNSGDQIIEEGARSVKNEQAVRVLNYKN